MTNRRLLLVDDDPGVRDAYAAVFAPRAPSSSTERSRLASLVLGVSPARSLAIHNPFSLTIARQGQEAAEALERLKAQGQAPAVAFVDMRMPPGWDGLTTIEALWRIDPRLQCVLCTAFSDFSWEEIVARLGTTDRLLILRKPFDRIEVLQMAEALCAKWMATEQAADQARQVARQQTILRGIIDHAGLLITLKDAQGRYLLANQGFALRHGRTEAEVLGRTDDHLFPDQAKDLAAREAAAMSEGVCAGEEDDPRVATPARFHVVRFTLTTDHPEGPLLCTVATDVTAFRDLESRYLQSQKMEALGRLAGGVAHDFNNLLAAIMGFSELALGGQVDGRTRGYLGQVLQAGQQASDLTRQLLAFSRRQVLNPQRVEVGAVVEDLVAMLTRLVGRTITITVVNQGPSWVLIDKSQLQQVLVNLVVNARDAMPQGGRASIEVHGGTPGRVRVIVADTGVGMAPEVLAHIWDPFFTTKAEGQGTGLGLSTVHGIVLQSGGGITVESEPGQGTRVVVDLPSVAEGVPVVATQPGPITGGRERLLIVDDRDDVRSLLVEILGSAGYDVVEAGDPRRIAEECPACDLLVTDVVMPGLEGPELLRRLRVRHPDLRVLFMTGHTIHPESLPGPVLAKPFSHRDLLAAVRQALG